MCFMVLLEAIELILGLWYYIFFENIHLLVILKCCVHDLRLPLIAIFAHDMLNGV